MDLEFSLRGQRLRVDMNRTHDLSIALRFDGPQPAFFGAAAAHAQPLRAGTFVGDVAAGGSCNCSTYTLTPHCNGTHTECVGHVTQERMSVRGVAPGSLLLARVLSVQPCSSPAAPGDLVITRELLEGASPDGAEAAPSGGAAVELRNCDALIVRTLPNPIDKAQRHYAASSSTPYFTAAAMQWIVQQEIQHLVVDLPSVDRTDDGGRLLGHRIFWGLPAGSAERARAARSGATITELAYIDDTIVDGLYLLNLQIAPFDSDAAPSRPLLYPLIAMPWSNAMVR